MTNGDTRPATAFEAPATNTRAGVLLGLGVGLLAGVMSGLFGVGGGTVLVPLFVLLLAMEQHRAHATSLAAIILTAGAGAVAFGREGAVAYSAGLAIAAGAVAGAYLGAGLMRRLSPRGLRTGFAIVMVLVAAQMLLGFTPDPAADAALQGTAALIGFLTLGLGAGVLSAIMGVGGGIIMVPAMVLLFGMSQHTAEGTSLLVIIPTAIAGSLRHSRSGYTDWRLGLIVGLGGIGGALLGARLALGLDADLLQKLFATFLLLIALRLFWSNRTPKAQ